MASLTDLAKKVRNTVHRNAQAFLRIEENDGGSPASIEYSWANLGRFMNASFTSDPVTSSQDQDGRESSQLFDITVSLALMQTSNAELSLLSELAMPSPGSLDRYLNGHTLYFSGDNQVTTSDMNDAIDSSSGETTFGTGSGELDDPNGILFKNVLLKPSPDIDLAGEESSIGIEFTGTLETAELDNLDTSQTIVVSPG
jgi:hypothetical protein